MYKKRFLRIVMKRIITALHDTIEDVQIVGADNGGIEVRLPESDLVPAVLSTIADIMHDYGCEDLQITTDQSNGKVWIEELESEED